MKNERIYYQQYSFTANTYNKRDYEYGTLGDRFMKLNIIKKNKIILNTMAQN